MDMKTTIFSYGATELSLMTGAMAQMAQYYRLPFFGTAGSGLVHDCSSWMDHGSLVSPEFMVLTHDIVDSVHHFMNGIPVTQQTLAVDVIDKVGPGGHYLTEKHTMDHFRQIKYSELFDRSIYEKWEAAGSKKFEDRLQELTLKKMAHVPRSLPEEIIKELDKMQASWK